MKNALLKRMPVAMLYSCASEESARYEPGPLPTTEAGLAWYLSRAATMMNALLGQGDEEDNIRFIRNTGIRFLSRAYGLWTDEDSMEAKLATAAARASRLKAEFPDIILQGAIYEAVSTEVETIPVPSWAFEAFGLPSQTRNFDYDAMLFPAGVTTGYSAYSQFEPTDHWGAGSSIPDIRNAETKLYFYYLARRLIDAGCESIHMGQTVLMGYHDPSNAHYTELVRKIREYGTAHGRRGFVLCDASDMLGSDGKLVFDFAPSFTGINENPPFPDAEIVVDASIGTIYGTIDGGITPGGWECDQLPCLIEIDNWGIDPSVGAPTPTISVYGYDEITWFSALDEEARNEWLRYEAERIRELQPDSYFAYPGIRYMTGSPSGKVFYYAHAPSAATPDGFNQEGSIKELVEIYGTAAP